MARTQVILIVAVPGNLQAGLQLLTVQFRNVETLVVADEESTLGAVERHNPALVIVDGDILDDNDRALIKHINGRWTHIRCLVLINRAEEREEALKSGADAAIVKGYPAARLAAVIKELMAAGERKDLEKCL